METIGSQVVCLKSQEWGSLPRTELIRSCNYRSDLPFQGLTKLPGRREKCEPRTHLVAIFQCVFPLESGSTASQVFLVVIFIFFCQLLRRFFQFTEELKENISVIYSLTHLSKPLVIPGKGYIQPNHTVPISQWKSAAVALDDKTKDLSQRKGIPELKGNLLVCRCDSFNCSHEEIEVLKCDVMCPCSSNQGRVQMTGEGKQAQIRNLQLQTVIY